MSILTKCGYKALLASLLVSWGVAVHAQSELPSVIVLFGDSTTVGYIPPTDPDRYEVRAGNGTTTDGAPTEFLNELLNDGTPKRPAIVTNWGYGGSPTSAGPDEAPVNGIDRLTTTLITASTTHSGSAYFILILYGSNDFASNIDPSTTRFNIERMISISRSRGFEPIIGGLLPRSDFDTAA